MNSHFAILCALEPWREIFFPFHTFFAAPPSDFPVTYQVELHLGVLGQTNACEISNMEKQLAGGVCG